MLRRPCCLLAVLAVLAVPTFAKATEEVKTTKTISLDGTWLLATDPQNIGRQQQWFQSPRPDAKPAKVPWIIQEAFPGYHGVAWYWRDFDAPANPHSQGRTLLRFWAVDYLAEVWLNGVKVGGHEGGEGVFVLDVTDTVKPGQNRLAVRVLNPTNEPIDGIVLMETPHRCKALPFYPGGLYNDGGIVDSVELLLVPKAYTTDLYVVPEPKTGDIRIQTVVHNASLESVPVQVEFTLAPAAFGETLQTIRLARVLPKGDTVIETTLKVEQPHLWNLNDPYLYRVTTRVRVEGATSLDERSTRCGLREFRFDNGYYRLNGQRLFLKSSHTAMHYPVGLHCPTDPDLARRDILLSKAMGFNAIRFFCAVPTRYQLDLCDELGLLVYDECFAGWVLQPSPKMAERFDREVSEMILRDRNHPSIVMWGLLNETPEGPVFRHAIDLLPMVHSLDDTRIVMLNSGLDTFIHDNTAALAKISHWNGGSSEPNVTYNTTPTTIQTLGVTWKPGQLALHPGRSGEFAVLRWTAPATEEVAIVAKFTGIAEKATTDVHIFHQGKSFFEGAINLPGNDKNLTGCKRTISVKAGDTIDFVVGQGNETYAGDTTAVAVTIRAGGKVYDAGRDFSTKNNPNGTWSYGYREAGPASKVATFKPFNKSLNSQDTEKASCGFGAHCNPGSRKWEDTLTDIHPYRRVPHTADIIHELRTVGSVKKPVFISEYGVGSAIDLVKTVHHFEQLGAEQLEDAQWYRQRLEQFMSDWNRWNMADTFVSPEDFFEKCIAKMPQERLLGLNAIRSNPHMVGHSITGLTDCGDAGEGIITLFRELKPGAADAIADGWAPLRWCLFAEPVNVYRKTPVRLEAVLANEDVLKPGKYPVRLQVVDPHSKTVFQRTIEVTIPDPHATPEPPMAISMFSEDVMIDGPSGKYRFLVTFERGAAAAGGETNFYVADPAELPKVETEVVLWGEDAELERWLKNHNIRCKPFASTTPKSREVILAAGTPPAPGGEAAFRELAKRIAQGSSVVFLSPSVFAKGDQPVAFVPLAKKGVIATLPSTLYHKDDWTKKHPIFDGLPSGGLMDYLFYREIISTTAWADQDVPAEVVAGAIGTSRGYSSGLTVSVNTLGAGRFILNTLLIRENLKTDPVAVRLLMNMLRYAGRDVEKPVVSLSTDFDQQLKAMGL